MLLVTSSFATTPHQSQEDAATTQNVFKSVAPDGSVTFSDKPRKGAKKIEVEHIQTFKAQTPSVSGSPSLQPSLTSPLGSQQADPFEYESIQIATPKDGETVWSNPGKLSVDVGLQPRLRENDKVALYLDGNKIKEATGSTRFQISGIQRGEHSLSAKVFNKSGKLMLESPAITIFMHKASTNMPARNAP